MLVTLRHTVTKICVRFKQYDRVAYFFIPCWKDEQDMTKAKARLRAKSKATHKSKKRENPTDQSGQNLQQGLLDPRASSIKGPGMSVNANRFSGARRGSARSK